MLPSTYFWRQVKLSDTEKEVAVRMPGSQGPKSQEVGYQTCLSLKEKKKKKAQLSRQKLTDHKIQPDFQTLVISPWKSLSLFSSVNLR